jgi:hypothetical protein
LSQIDELDVLLSNGLKALRLSGRCRELQVLVQQSLEQAEDSQGHIHVRSRRSRAAQQKLQKA